MTTKDYLAKLISDATGHDAIISYPPNDRFGDYATNIPLILTKEQSKNPMEIAEELKSKFVGNEVIDEVTVAKPGFLNFKLSAKYLSDEVAKILKEGQKYGTLTQTHPQKIQVEFVSANPTGPLHIGNFRGGPLGDTLARVLTKAGHKVEREYYHNDVGNQVKLLGESILCRVEGREIPENGYQGAYVKELANIPVGATRGSPELTPEALGKYAVDYFRDEALKLCEQVGIKFDKIVSESEVRDSGWTTKALDILKEKGFLKENDGATWFAPSDDFLKDRESVVIKSDGEFDYFSNDIGYHLNKFDRGFDKVIDIWGANHHGHIARMKAAIQALGSDPNKLIVILYQWITMLRNGEKLSMSKRAGTFVTAKEVIDDVGSDAVRFMFLTRDANTPLEFDLDLVKKQARENPVYYVQYAHARMSSILSKVPASVGAERALPVNSQLTAIEEVRLTKHLIKFPDLVSDLSQNYAVHQLTNYALELADKFHKFYENCPVLAARDSTVDEETSKSRVALVTAAKTILAETLNLLGVSAPEKM